MRRFPRFREQVCLDSLVILVLQTFEVTRIQLQVSQDPKASETYLSDKRLDTSIEEIDWIASLPSTIRIVEIVARQVPGDRSHDEIRESVSVPHPVRELVVLDPWWMSSISLVVWRTYRVSEERVEVKQNEDRFH